MRVVEVPEFGPPEVLRVAERPDPVPAAGEVVVEVEASHVLWVETAVRSGAGRDWFPLRPPYVPGTGVVGREVRSGRRVVAHTGLSGGYAEKVAVPSTQTTPLPDGLPVPEAAALAHDATTALALLDRVAVTAQDRVLVVGASGGLGLALAQLARSRGAQVVALARGRAKVERVRALGFEVVDTDRPGWLDAAAESLPGGADVVLDNVGGELGRAAVPLLADGGRWSSHGTPGGSFTALDPAEVAARHLDVVGIGDAQLDVARRMELMATGLRLGAEGGLTAVVGQTFAFDRAMEAHRAIESRQVFGSTVLLGWSPR